ncbi:nucleotidyl transferase AbiEii/AbiGii toxin family protein, partial [Actinophytocola sp.]|uniref:nucleotidyl transferase AbiEii/AbiGii toxin family protein n=1 Tax=Actinophytocola sp. TaxID=1872138 RepID=UPI00389AE7D5
SERPAPEKQVAHAAERPAPQKQPTPALEKPAPDRPAPTPDRPATQDRPAQDRTTQDKPAQDRSATQDKPGAQDKSATSEKPVSPDKPTGSDRSEKPVTVDKSAPDRSAGSHRVPGKGPKQEEVAGAVAAVAHLSPDHPAADRGAHGAHPDHTPNGPGDGFVRRDDDASRQAWNERRDGAKPTRFSRERFQHYSRGSGLLRAENGQVSGKITQIRYDTRHFEASPGKWVVEFTVPLDLVSPGRDMDAPTRRAAADELQQELDEHFNFRHRWPGKGQFEGSQVHFTVEADTPNGITPGWDADPTRNVPVEVRDSSKGDAFDRAIVPRTNQVQWDLAAPVGSRLHEYFHFMGLGEGYQDPKLSFNPKDAADGLGGVMGEGDHFRKELTPAQLAQLATVHEQSRPVISHSFTDTSTHTPAVNKAAPGGLVNSIYADGPYSAQHSPNNAPGGNDPKRPPRGPNPNQGPSGGGRRQQPSDLPAIRSAADRPSRSDARDAKHDPDTWDERPVPVPVESSAEATPVKGWTLDEAGDWFTNTMAKYFGGRGGGPVVPFLSGGAALARQGGVRPPKDLDFRITASEVGFKDFSDPVAQRFLDHLNKSAKPQLQNDYRARLKTGEVPKGASVGEFAPLRKSGAGSTSMGSLNILGQEISLTVVPNDRPDTTRVGGDGPGKDIHVLTPDELVADKLRTMISRTKTDQDSVKKVAQDVFDVLDAMDVADRDAGRGGDTTAGQLSDGLAARADQYSETNVLGSKLQHWDDKSLHDLMTGHAVETAKAHLKNGERRRALEKLLDDVRDWGGREKADRMWKRLEDIGRIPVGEETKKALRPLMADFDDRRQYGPGPESRGSGRPEVRPGAAPGEEPSHSGEPSFAPPVEDLLSIHADDITRNVRDHLVNRNPKLSNKPDSTAHAEQIARVLAFSGGFRPLADSAEPFQTQEAFGLGKNDFSKGFDQLHKAGLVAPSPEGLRLRKAGWDLVPTGGPQRVVDLEGNPVDPPSSSEGSPARSPERSPVRSGSPAQRPRSVSPLRASTPENLAEIEFMGRQAADALATENRDVAQGLRNRAKDELHKAGWHSPFPGDAYRRAVDIVAHSILDHDSPELVRDTAQAVTSWKDDASHAGPAGDGVRLADDGSVARPDGTSTGSLPPGVREGLPPAVRKQWEQARQVTGSSKLPPEMAGWVSTRANQILANRHVTESSGSEITPMRRDLIARDQALNTIVSAQLLKDHAAGLSSRQAERNALGVVNDLAGQLRDQGSEFPNPPSAPRPKAGSADEYFAKPVPPGPYVLSPRPGKAGPERSFEIESGSTRLRGDQRPKLDSLIRDLAEAKATRDGLGYLPPRVEVSGDGAHVIAGALAERGIEAAVRPGREGGADVHVDWDMKRPADFVQPEAPKSERVTDTRITWDPPEGTPIVRQDPVRAILDDPKWAHSKDGGAPWFDPKADHIPADEIAAVAKDMPVTGRVRGDQGGLTTDSIIRLDAARLDTWRGPIAYDVRSFDMPGGKGGVADHHVKLFLDKGNFTDAQVKSLQDRAKAGVDELYNQGYRMVKGRQFHVSVDFVTDPADAHGVVKVGGAGGKENQLSWPVNLSGKKIAHEIGHFLGTHDQYFEKGPNKPIFQHQDGRGRVVNDNGIMTDAVEDPNARFMPRDMWRIENRQRELESDLPVRHDSYPAPPRTPGGSDRRLPSLLRYLRDRFGSDHTPAPAPEAAPHIDFEPPSVSREFAADAHGIFDDVVNNFPRSLEEARDAVAAASHALDEAQARLGEALAEHGHLPSSSTAPEPAPIAAARGGVAMAEAALDIAHSNLEVWDHQAEHGAQHYDEWLNNQFTDADSLHSTDYAASQASEPSGARPPKRLADVLPRADWYRLYLNPKDIAAAERMYPDNPGSLYDNQRSPGFQAGMEGAYERFLNPADFTAQRLNSDLYRQMHEAVTAQLGREIPWSGRGTTGFPLGSSRPSPDVFSDTVGGRPLMVDAAALLRSGQKAPIAPVTILDTWTNRDKPIVRTNYRQNEVQGLVDSVFDDFYNDLGRATNDTERFRAIGRVVRNLHIVHPFEDANGRLNIHLLLPRLLLEAGFQPILFRDLVPLFDGSRTLDQVADAMARGQGVDLTEPFRSTAPEYSSSESEAAASDHADNGSNHTDNGSDRSDGGSDHGDGFSDGAFSDHAFSDDGRHSPATAEEFPNPPAAPSGKGRHQQVSDLPAVATTHDQPSRQEARDAKYDEDFWDEQPVPVPSRAGDDEATPVKGWSLEQAGDWFTNTMARYFAGRPGGAGAVPFLSGGAALGYQGGVRPPKDLDFRITASEAGFKDFSEPGGKDFLKFLNQSAKQGLQNDYRAKLGAGEVPRGASIGEFAPLRRSGAGSTSMGSLNILGQEISLTVVPNDRPNTTRLGGDGPGKDIHVLTPDELAADKLRTMISRTKTDQDSVKKVAQDVFDVLDAFDVADRQAGRSGDTTATQVKAGLAARAGEYSETNILGSKLQHWTGEDLHDLMTGHAVLTAQAHLKNGERRRALEKLLDDVKEWGGQEHADRMWDRLEKFASMPVRDEVKTALRPLMADWDDRAQYGPGPEARGSGRPEVRWGAAPGDEPVTGAETVFPAPPVGDLLKIHGDDIAGNVRDKLVEKDPKLAKKPHSTAHAPQIMRVPALSGGFLPLLDHRENVQTLEAFGQTKSEFAKGYQQLKDAGLVAPGPEGLRLRKAGWDLVPTGGPQRVVDLEGNPVDPPSSSEGSPARSPERSPVRSGSPAQRPRSVSPLRASTPENLAEIELTGRQAAEVLAQESDAVARGLRNRAMGALYKAGWQAPNPPEMYARAVDIVAQSMLEGDGPAMVREIAETVAAHRGKASSGGLAGDGIRLAEDGSLARQDGTPTGTLPQGVALPAPLRARWEQARQVTGSSKLPPDMAGWISTRANQILANRHVTQAITSTVSSAQRDLIARDQALNTIVSAQLLKDHAAGLSSRQAERNALGVVNDLAGQLRDQGSEFPNPPSAPRP